MSTNVVRPASKSGSLRPSQFLGVAAAGLALVISVGVALAVDQGNDITGNPPAHPMVSEAHRAKAEILAERAAAVGVSPGANMEEYRLDLERFERAQHAWSQRLTGLAGSSNPGSADRNPLEGIAE